MSGSRMIGSRAKMRSLSLTVGSLIRGESNITGLGQLPGQQRVVREGLSESRVPVPTMMASQSERSRCMRARVAGEDISIGEPSGAFSFPCEVSAHFRSIHGRCLVCAVKKRSLIASHSSRNTFSVSSIPASRNIWIPRPDTFGFGSPWPMTHLFTPLSHNSLAHGGVLP